MNYIINITLDVPRRRFEDLEEKKIQEDEKPLKNRCLNLSVLKNVEEQKLSKGIEQNKNQKGGEMHSPCMRDAAKHISIPGTSERSLGKATHIFLDI